MSRGKLGNSDLDARTKVLTFIAENDYQGRDEDLEAFVNHINSARTEILHFSQCRTPRELRNGILKGDEKVAYYLMSANEYISQVYKVDARVREEAKKVAFAEMREGDVLAECPRKPSNRMTITPNTITSTKRLVPSTPVV